MNSKYIEFCIGVTVGCLLTVLAMSVQPREINVTFPQGIEAKLAIDAVDNCIVRGDC